MIFSSDLIKFPDLQYERRIVSFFDILGWEAYITKAGNDPGSIAQLASVLRFFSNSMTSLVEKMEGAHITSFSDNMVVSVPYHADRVLPTLEGLASVFLGAACCGFLFRGAMTIGDLFHDEEIVFGPALNRAHNLEKCARYPCALLDPDIRELTTIRSDFVSIEEGVAFLDPFNYAFAEQKLKPNAQAEWLREQWEVKTSIDYCTIPQNITVNELIQFLFDRIQYEMESATVSDVKIKYEWLHKRLKQRISARVDG